MDFIVISAYKDTVLDNYEEGEIGETYSSNMSHFKGIIFNTIEDLAKQTFLPNIKENWCIFDGRITTDLLEDKDGCEASEREIEKWKKNDMKLYSARYNFHVLEVKIDKPTDELLNQNLGISIES